MFKLPLLGAVPFDYCPPSTCFSDRGDADPMGGGLDAHVDSILAKLDDTPAAKAEEGDGAAEGEEQRDQATAPADGPDGAPDDQPSADEDGDPDEPEEQEAQPSIDLPPFWDKEQAQHWKAIPRATQEYLHLREGQRDTAVRGLQNEVAEVKRAFQPEVDATRQERQRYVDQASTYISLAEELDPILKAGQSLDWQKAAAEDPAGTQQLWFAYQQKREHLKGAIQQRDAILERINQERLAAEGVKLIHNMPAWHGKTQQETFENAKTGLDAIRQFAIRQYGYRPEEVRVIPDERQARMAEDARKYHELLAQQNQQNAQRAAAKQATAQQRQAPAPRLAASPGQSEGNTGAQPRPRRAAMAKIGRDHKAPLEQRIDAILAQI